MHLHPPKPLAAATIAAILGFAILSARLVAAEAPSPPPGFAFLNTSFENASPLYWDFAPDGAVHVFLLYDHERSSPNRAAGHWHFQVQAQKGSDVTLVINNFDNVWNGTSGSPVSEKSICYVSSDGAKWRVIRTEKIEGNRLRIRLHMDEPALYLARLEPYRLSDLEKLKASIRNHPLVEIRSIGRTVEGRDLEIIRVGKPDAPFRVFLRARAHAWEPGGNWVVQGLIRRLLCDDETARRSLARYCLYVMPLANKDGVARGLTRFNLLGKDLNRDWDRPADPVYAPENAALESWFQTMAAKKQQPNLAIDLHNDEGGRLHISRPNIDLEPYLARMNRLEQLLRKRTWFREGSTGASFRNPGSIGEGLLERFGINACVLELNCNWIAGLNDYPSGKNWELLGEQFAEVFCEFFGAEKAERGN